MALVSVIIPYFRKKSFIQKTLTSVLNQTFQDFEIILIYDDENKDDLDFVRKIKSLDKRIKLLINNKNIGAGFSRNIGIRKSNGKYICFIDADDLWHKDKLKIQIEFMEKNKYLATHTSYKIKNKNNKIIGTRKAKKIDDFKKLLSSCDIGLSTVIIKKNVLIEKKLKFPNLKTKEDYVLWLNLVRGGVSIYSLDKNFTTWTKAPGSLSSSSLQKIMDGFTVYNQYMNFNIFKSIYLVLILSLNFFKKTYKNL